MSITMKLQVITNCKITILESTGGDQLSQRCQGGVDDACRASVRVKPADAAILTKGGWLLVVVSWYERKRWNLAIEQS